MRRKGETKGRQGEEGCMGRGERGSGRGKERNVMDGKEEGHREAEKGHKGVERETDDARRGRGKRKYRKNRVREGQGKVIGGCRKENKRAREEQEIGRDR